MKFRIVAAAAAAVLLSSCSGGIYDTSDFMTARQRVASAAKPGAQTPAEGAEPAEPTAQSADGAAVPAAAAEQTATSVEPATSTGAAADPAPAATPPKTVAASAAPRGLLAMFRTEDPATATPEAAAVSATAAKGATPIAAAVAEASNAPIEDAPADEEFSEAALAGEEESDPDKVAPVEVPFDDGQVHDFVNVYESRPDKPVDMIDGLPGVTWPDGIMLVSRTPDDDPSNFFDGPLHPFARTVPGVPRATVRAANGLLLAHSAINVSCIKPQLLNLVRRAEAHFGKNVVVTSGYRSPSHNRRVRGAKHSQHMACAALDLYMPGVARDDLARFFYAQSDRGGIGLYCHTRSIHVDTGKRRQWRWPCRRGRG